MAGEITKIQKEVELELSNPEVLKTLVTTTFKGLQAQSVKQAMVEGMLRGFTFKDFLEKNIYAIPFRDTYSLVTSIDHARKIGMRSGIIGKSKPEFDEDANGSPIACSITVKRKLPNSNTIGEYTEKVYMAEYSTGRNLWASKPRTMLAKVAEMHALRMACPEELAQSYVEEELEKKDGASMRPTIDMDEYRKKLETSKSTEELKTIWASLPPEAKAELGTLKESLKKEYAGLNI